MKKATWLTAKKKILQFEAEIKAIDDATGRFSGYGSVFGNVDSYNEIVDRGAFTESLAKHGKPALLWQHRAGEPCGVYVTVMEDERGLFVEGVLNLETQVGREAYALLKQGAIRGLSIGFRSLVEETDKDNGVVHLKKVRLYEVSLVTFPANEEATVTTVRAAPGTLREFENFLRDAGYSGEDAKLIAGFGYKALEARRDGGDVQATLAGINSLVERVRKSIPHAASSRG